VLQAVLLDVGGTLWPNDWPARPGDQAERVARLAALSPGVGHAAAECLEAALSEMPDPADGGEQDADGTVRAVLERLGFTGDLPVPSAVRRAMCLPALGRTWLLPGADALFAVMAEHHLPGVLVSNTLWRDGWTYLEDFAALGVRDRLTGAVTSVDVGFRKPHPAMFDTALALVGAGPDACVMVGNSELSDVEAARRLGMRTIMVAIEEPLPVHSAADVVTDSLVEVGRVIGELADS
jgi:FMN phosphatase YigB (HAD superfamily)